MDKLPLDATEKQLEMEVPSDNVNTVSGLLLGAGVQGLNVEDAIPLHETDEDPPSGTYIAAGTAEVE
jgi:hypothetical protein